MFYPYEGYRSVTPLGAAICSVNFDLAVLDPANSRPDRHTDTFGVSVAEPLKLTPISLIGN